MKPRGLSIKVLLRESWKINWFFNSEANSKGISNIWEYFPYDIK